MKSADWIQDSGEPGARLHNRAADDGHDPAYWLEVPAISVGILFEALRSQGHDPLPLLRSLEIPLDVISEPGRRIGWKQEIAFQEQFAALTDGDFSTWVQTGRHYGFQAFESFGLAMVVAPTLRMFTQIVIALKTKYTEAVASVIEEADGNVGIEFTFPESLDRQSPVFRFSVVRDLIATVTMLEHLWHGPFPMTNVAVPLAIIPTELAAALPYRLVPKANTIRLVWPKKLMDAPLPRGNHTLFQLYVNQASRSVSWVHAPFDIDQQVLTLLKQPGNCGLDMRKVAARLRLAPRTLQRRLCRCKVSFRELREAARQNEATRLLRETELPISAISDSVGYFEVASFSNAFHRWSGESPRSYRERHMLLN